MKTSQAADLQRARTLAASGPRRALGSLLKVRRCAGAQKASPLALREPVGCSIIV